jgi:hypothetical protein
MNNERLKAIKEAEELLAGVSDALGACVNGLSFTGLREFCGASSRGRAGIELRFEHWNKTHVAVHIEAIVGEDGKARLEIVRSDDK